MKCVDGLCHCCSVSPSAIYQSTVSIVFRIPSTANLGLKPR